MEYRAGLRWQLVGKSFRNLCLAYLLGTPIIAAAQTGDAELRAMMEDMREQMAAMQRRITELEEQPRSRVTTEQLKPARTTGDAGADRFQLSGDLRYRRDAEDDAARDSDRNRNRIRARAQLQARATESLDIILGVASGEDDPLSTNQTLGSAASTKDWRLDLAYFDWEIFDNVRYQAGKKKNPVYRPAGHFMLWDSDLRPEGMAVKFGSKRWFGSLGFEFIESDNRGGLQDDAQYYTAQLGYNQAIGDSTLRVGAGYFFFDVAGKEDLEISQPRGNTLNDDGSYANDYQELELFAELNTQIFRQPLLVWVDYVENLDANDQEIGWAAGANLGSTSNPGGWKAKLFYQDLEADAVFGLFTDSDFAPSGTDNAGWGVSASYQWNARTTFSATYYNTEYGGFSLGEKLDYERLFLDMQFTF